MSWQTHIEKLQDGESVKFRPRGNSMSPKIDSGQLITVSPKCEKLKKGDIVLCKVKGKIYVHIIKSVRGDKYLIGNNKGHDNGWINKKNVFGIIIKVED